MKQFLRLVFASVLIILSAASAYAAEFTDLEQGDKYFPAVSYLADRGVLNGYDDGSFKPDNIVNRAEAVKIISNAFEIAQSESFSDFSDVSSSDWFHPFVMGAVDAGFVQGYTDGSFKPGQTVNLAETLKMVIVATDADLPDVEFDVFVDVPKDQWFAPHSLYARDKNIILADDFGQVYPAQDITRGEMAEIVYRMLYMNNESKSVYPLSTNWPLHTSGRLPFKMKYDEEWQIVQHNYETVFYKSDARFDQFSPVRVYPNSAKVVVTVDTNDEGLSRSDYFSNIRSAFPGAQTTEFDLNGMKGLEILFADQRIVDWYLYLDNGMVLAVYTEYGDGLLKLQLPKIIIEMLLSIEYQDVVVLSEDDILTQILGNVLEEGKGEEMIDLLPDAQIIHTDTIGVGTGAIDYYYSATFDRTFKYERAGDAILAVSDGQTSAF